ncbi:MAG: hypothetical protein ACLT2Z_02550 [Eubacterium sp.]
MATFPDRELFIPTLERENIIDYFDDIVTVGEAKGERNFLTCIWKLPNA